MSNFFKCNFNTVFLPIQFCFSSEICESVYLSYRMQLLHLRQEPNHTCIVYFRDPNLISKKSIVIIRIRSKHIYQIFWDVSILEINEQTKKNCNYVAWTTCIIYSVDSLINNAITKKRIYNNGMLYKHKQKFYKCCYIQNHSHNMLNLDANHCLAVYISASVLPFIYTTFCINIYILRYIRP